MGLVCSSMGLCGCGCAIVVLRYCYCNIGQPYCSQTLESCWHATPSPATQISRLLLPSLTLTYPYSQFTQLIGRSSPQNIATYLLLEVLGPSEPQILAEEALGLEFDLHAPSGRSGRVTQADD